MPILFRPHQVQYQLALEEPPLQHLQVFEHPDLAAIFPGFVHLISGYAKVGKTELLYEWCLAWAAQGLNILYYTEESPYIWNYRMLLRGPDPGDIPLGLAYARGYSYSQILEDMSERQDFQVVVVDTTLLLQIPDSNDNTSVAERLNPIINMFIRPETALIFLHHHNKAGGQRGRGITGSYAFLALVDVSLEIYADKYKPDQRNVTGLSRIHELPDFSYERKDKKMVLLGDSSETGLQAVRRRILATVAGSPQPLSQKEIEESLEEPRPSSRSVLDALQSLKKDKMLSASRGSGKGSPLFYSIRQ